MTMQAAFHFPSLSGGVCPIAIYRSNRRRNGSCGMTHFTFSSLVWDWPIAIYLFLLGISAGATTLSVLLRRKGAGSERHHQGDRHFWRR